MGGLCMCGHSNVWLWEPMGMAGLDVVNGAHVYSRSCMVAGDSHGSHLGGSLPRCRAGAQPGAGPGAARSLLSVHSGGSVQT